MVQILSSKTSVSAFELLYPVKYFQNFSYFIWNNIAIFQKTSATAVATLAQGMFKVLPVMILMATLLL